MKLKKLIFRRQSTLNANYNKRAPIADNHELANEIIRVNTECPNLHFAFNNSNVSQYLAALPTGVKFNPSDIELIEHLTAKCGVENLKPHTLIDHFIPTLEGDEGICYTHPENLPGSKKDGSTFHCFYRVVNAYASGKRKRRRIQNQESTSTGGHIRWHKTGKTKAITKNEVQIGSKKIMVLYGPSKAGPGTDKCPWVMHQYHLGADEEEKEGEFVVSKIFYQPEKEAGKSKKSLVISEYETGMVVIPRTPIEKTPDPPRARITASSEQGLEDYLLPSLVEDADNEIESAIYLGGESKAEYIGGPPIDDSKPIPASLAHDINNEVSVNPRDESYFGDLFNLEFETPPDFQFNELLVGSQGSLLEWMIGL